MLLLTQYNTMISLQSTQFEADATLCKHQHIMKLMEPTRSLSIYDNKPLKAIFESEHSHLKAQIKFTNTCATRVQAYIKLTGTHTYFEAHQQFKRKLSRST